MHVHELLASIGLDNDSSRTDLLSAIVKARKAAESGGKMAFTESETIGNMFMSIFAGYETSAITLHTVLLMLACCPEIQS